MEVSVSGTDETKKPKLLYTPPKPDTIKQEQLPAVKPLWPKDSAQGEVVDWKRLQFRSATTHNGRRRLQNYFTLTVAVFAELENRQRVRLVYAQSRPIVVRGRNPLFYRNRQTIAISDRMPVKEKSPTSDEDSEPVLKKVKPRPEEDGLYEYFPMPMNYYQPPVEVVYRPHAITHSIQSMKRVYTAIA